MTAAKRGVLPLPASGERVGVRGSFNLRIAPHPDR
jgi:hypothetical protein